MVNSLTRMENLLYMLKDWWAQHGRNILRYGPCAGLCLLGMYDQQWLTVLLAVVVGGVLFSFDYFELTLARHGGYVLAALLLAAGIYDSNLFVSGAGVVLAIVLFSYEYFNLEYWRQRGANVLGQNKPPKEPKP